MHKEHHDPSEDLRKRLEDLRQALQRAETERAHIGGQLVQLEARYQEFIASLKKAGFKNPQEALDYIETELTSLEQASQDLDLRLSPILKESS